MTRSAARTRQDARDSERRGEAWEPRPDPGPAARRHRAAGRRSLTRRGPAPGARPGGGPPRRNDSEVVAAPGGAAGWGAAAVYQWARGPGRLVALG